MGKKKAKEPETPAKDEVGIFEFDPLELVSKKPHTVVLMLDSPEEHVLQSACEALYKFAEKCDENRQELLNLGALEPLLKLVLSEDKVVRRNSTMCLGTMAQNAVVKKELRKLSSIQPLVALLGPDEDVLCHEFASLALSSMAAEFSCKVEIFEQGGLEPIIKLLSSTDCDVQKNSVEAISLLVQDYHSRSAIRELNGLQPLLTLLTSEYAIIQQLSLESLIQITLDAENRAALRELEGLERLVEFVGKKEYDDLHVQALQVLSNCLQDVESMQLIQTSGGLQKLMAFAAESTIPEVQQHAAKAISLAAKNGENRKIFHEQECEKTLITLLSAENPGVQSSASQALAVMSENLSSRDEVGKLGSGVLIQPGWGKECYRFAHYNINNNFIVPKGIPPLISLLSSDNSEVNESVTLALANLTTANNTNCSEVVDKGGIEPLIALLSDGKPLVQANAAVCLTNLATEESWRSEIQQRGVVPALVQALKSNAAVVQSKAGIAAAAFVCDADSRNEFRAEGGLPRLVELLRSGDDDVRRSVAWAVLQCGNDLSTATEICRLGGLDVLGEISLSSTRQSGFAKAARECLLDSNLPAKYAMTGSLSCNNIIQDGFYDCGPMRADSKFLTLEELNSLFPDAHRPIILINSRNPERYVKADDVPTPFPVSSLSLRPQYNIDLLRWTEKLPQEFTKDFGSILSVDNTFLAYSRKTPSPVLIVPKEPEKSSEKIGKGSKSHKDLKSKSRIMREREEQRQREEEAALSSEISLVQQEEEPSWQPPADEVLRGYIEEVQCNIQPLNSNKEQIEALAKFVSDKMGGPVDRESLSTFSYELPISQLKVELNSNILPIGKIQTGIFYHRALLFKALADRIAVSCSLVRGQYNRAWNEVLLCDEGQDGQPRFPPKSFIVDLMHFPGRLMSTDAPEATLYQRL
ncbi:Armadillo repeat-containing protein 3 [Acropora cervicornis]|uniref:Armadillo repeat-containing protein 3 n=1 Tax=Acropora cervicornis TaxID=6130 RepID=A0AAD9Q8Y4_ACRCE|nr:Armadillo repeat-containing protein 3 [Acropora cervicornis]